MAPCHLDKERGEATLINVIFPTQSVPPYTETMPELFSQQLYSSEQRWQGINAQVYQLLPPKEPVQVQMDCDTIILHLHNVVDLQRQSGARIERGISYRGGYRSVDPIRRRARDRPRITPTRQI